MRYYSYDIHYMIDYSILFLFVKLFDTLSRYDEL
jgi:hypothetical protein